MRTSSTFVAAGGDGYELNMGRWSRRLAGVFLDYVGAGNIERVLDVGCGTGHLAAAVAARSNSVTVHGVDLAPAYIEYARRQHASPRLEFGVGDACDLPYPDNTFDQVLSLLVLHFLPCPADAIAKMRRVAMPGARVAAAVWDVREGFVANRMFFDTAAAVDPAAGERRAKNYTRPLTRPGELADDWRSAGFVDASATELHVRMEYASFDDDWAPYLGKDGPGAEYVGKLNEDERKRLEQAVRAAYLDGESDGPRSYAALAWAVMGIAP